MIDPLVMLTTMHICMLFRNGCMMVSLAKTFARKKSCIIKY
jgi:hypothetical protein